MVMIVGPSRRRRLSARLMLGPPWGAAVASEHLAWMSAASGRNRRDRAR